MMSLFLELAIIVCIATLLGLLMKALRQPILIGYIIAGLITGPYLLNIVTSPQTIEIFSSIGVALLLFVVGLHLNPKTIKEVGKISLIIGLGQAIFASSLGFLISLLFGFNIIISLYIGVALIFSSTIILMKIITDKGDLDRLYGKICIGFIIVQDIIAVLALMIISSMNQGSIVLTNLLFKFGTGLILILVVFFLGMFLLPKVTKLFAKSQELLMLFSISWALILAGIFFRLDFSMEVGAFLAGITLSMSPYRFEISSKMRPLRDFFIVLFFIFLGNQMVFTNISQYILPIFGFSLLILIGNPFIVMVLMGILGYTKKTGFQTGLTGSQISEFSLIFIALGVRTGHLTTDILSLITAVALITMAGSSYMNVFSEKIYPKLQKYLSIFEKSKIKEKTHDITSNKLDVILFGYDKAGSDLVKYFKEKKVNYLVVDYDPTLIHRLEKKKINCIYGDVTNQEFLNDINFNNCKMIISTITSFDANMLILRRAKNKNSKIVTIVLSHNVDYTFELYKAGATYVVMPHLVGGKYVSELIDKHKFNRNKYLEEKFSNIRDLTYREELRHQEY